MSDLLKSLSDIIGIEWIRLQYAYPSGFPMDVFDAMNERDNICNYLDMPLQHISDNMLKVMRRGITKQKTIDLVAQIRDKVPNIALRTTLIAGHPGETDKDFDELLEFVEKTRFDRLGVFTYSHEEKTLAGDTMEDTILENIKKKRAEDVMALQEKISTDLNLNKVGKDFKVLFDRKEGNHYVGRTEFDSPEVDNEVLVEAKGNYVRIGDFANVKITQTEAFDLYGNLVH